MKKIKSFLVGFIVLLFIFNTNVAFGDSITIEDKKSEIGVKIDGTSDSVKPPEDKKIPKDNTYKPTEPSEIKKLLPQTGEIILSFLVILIGFSVVLFLTGFIMLRHTMKIYAFN